MYRLQTMFLTIAVALALSGCGKPAVSDDAIANDVKAKLYSDPVAKTANVNVAVKSGVVTLTGDAPSSDVELAAVKAANSASGVQRVDDQIKVDTAAAQLPNAGNAQAPPPAAAAPTPVATPTDTTPPPSERRHRRRDTDSSASDGSAAAPVSTVVTIPAGTSVSVQTIDTINSAKSQVGQEFRASLNAPITNANGVTVIPSGQPVTLALVQSKGAGRIAGKAELEVRLQSIGYNGSTYPVTSSTVTEVGKSRGKQTAVRAGIGAAAGAIIGAIAGGGKGAAIGSAAGGGAGIGYQVFTHGQQVSIPSESVLAFTLQSPVTLQ